METYDVVIIGSGYGGSVPAARLAEAGMKVLVLERGPRLATKDLVQSDHPKDITRVIDVVVMRSNLAYRTGTMVGGASIPMDGAHFRMPQKSFDQIDAAGRPYWPQGFSRATMDPYYDTAEQMLKVRQVSWSEIPKSGGLFAKMLDAAGASCERARMNYTDCWQCGFCTTGCIFDKKMTLLHTYIPFAEMHGAEFRAGASVDHIEPMGTGYRVVYSSGGVDSEVFGQRVIVGCGGVYTPALLLRSKKYLPSLSAQLGENFNNNGEHTFIGIVPPEEKYACYKGADNAMLMSFNWFESDGITMHPGSGLEPTVLAAHLQSDGAPWPKRAWGMEYKRFVEEIYPSRLIAFSVLGLAPGNHAITVDDDGKVDTDDRDPTAWNAYLDRVDAILADVSKKSGVALLPTVPRELTGTTSAHLLSACRMAETSADGVVGPDHQVFGYENLYVCDASAMPFALGVNPALTITAVAERAAAGIIARG
jgi:choline dehydrogenase-like flavoprotein